MTNNHQLHNAFAFRRAGGAVVIEEKKLTAALLKDTVYSLADNRKKRENMRDSLLKIAVYDATQRIYDVIMETLKS
ncbi:UDP-N-acetylglucosamine--N-acetylmuramyl-(pentapeptide) pyrophosphoryl-undecaprenol N-acetylglucosamine transferase [bioreactor metagenome]|uniref:UDP-N-acetylglucosamine--N-acetylmuramyl-(Pentapeptide) pyrophosphoryl-undecaprenol N-acetylglucosamine transferase n=1 Tax=bioreactor metagenome TaxID=1076179 RepID=A0A645IHJ3_9ZZZZ